MSDPLSPNIVLTGVMGTGKSAVGRRVASESGRTFVDLDAEIVAAHGDIPQLFAEGGEERFRQIERETVAKFAPKRNQVIATGGGTMLDQENVVAFLGAQVFTLTASPETIEERVRADGIGSRPLLAKSTDVGATIRSMLADRDEAYSKFPTVDTTNKTLEQVVDDLRAAGASIAEASAFDPEAAKNKTDRILYMVVGVVAALALIVLILVLTF